MQKHVTTAQTRIPMMVHVSSRQQIIWIVTAPALMMRTVMGFVTTKKLKVARTQVHVTSTWTPRMMMAVVKSQMRDTIATAIACLTRTETECVTSLKF